MSSYRRAPTGARKIAPLHGNDGNVKRLVNTSSWKNTDTVSIFTGFGCVFRKECFSFTQGGRCTMLSPAFLVISASLRAANCSECLLQRCFWKGLDLTLGTSRRRSSLPSRNLVPQASKEAQHARFAARVPSKRRHSGRWRLRCSFCSPRTAQGEFVCHRKLLASGLPAVSLHHIKLP